MPGQPVNFEIPADDTAKAREFYQSLFGWHFETSQGEFEYDTSRISEHSGAAITNMEPGKRGIRVYFDVDDIIAGTARVEALGGVAGQPHPVPGLGWTAICQDTEGNEFGLWQNDLAAPGPTY
jgi:uncharacterized protein